MGSTADDEVCFFSLLGPDVGAADDPQSPVAALIQHLQIAGIGFSVHESVMSREEAAGNPELAHLYPQGPNSGPAQVVLYEFFVRRCDWANADRVARACTGDQS